MAVSREECLGINNLNEVHPECKHLSAKWEEIGLNLGILKPSLDVIKKNNLTDCEQCMIEMLSKWLKKENKKCIPSWRSLCQALYSVDEATADEIATKHHATDYAKQEGGNTSDDQYMYLKEMCGCKKCTVEDWKQGRRCETPNVEKYPKFVLLNPNQKIAEQFDHKLSEENKLFAMTKQIDKKFCTCSSRTWSSLKYEVERRGFIWQRRRKQNISDIVMELCTKFSLSIPLHVKSIPELNDFFSKLHVSWFNFEPIRFIATHRLNNLYPELVSQWEDYVQDFKKYCSERNLREYASILFSEESDNIFIIEVDEQYNKMKLSDISLLRDSLCVVLGCDAISVHLVTVKIGSLLLSFCYCFDDYINKFNLTPRQLKSLAEIKLCKITSLEDKNNLFVYNNIQSCKILPLKCGFEESEQPNEKSIVAKSVGHKTKKTVSTVEQLDLEISEKQLQVILNNFPDTSIGHKTSRTMSIIEKLDLEISEKQLQVILNNYPVTEDVEIQTLTEESKDVIMKESTEIDQELQRKLEIEKNKSLEMSQELDFLRNQNKLLEKKLALTSTLSLDEQDKQTMEVEKDYQMTQKIEPEEKEQTKPDTEKELLPKSGFNEMSEFIHTLPLVPGQPGPPGKLLVVNTTSNSIDLRWEKPQENPDNIDGYKVLFRSKDDPPNSEWKSQQTNGVVEHITISGLVPEKTYYFKVQAMYNQVEGETSTFSEAYLKCTLSSLGEGQYKVPHQAPQLSAKALPAPGMPKVINITHSSIELTWKKPKPCGLSIEYYIVSCFCLDNDDNDDDDNDDDDDEPQCQSFETKRDESTILIPGLIDDTNYQFSVKAQYKTGLSKHSKKSAVIKTEQLLLVSPGQPKAVNITHNSIELTWKEPKPCGEKVECYIVSCFCLDNDDENDDDTVKRKPLEIMSNENTIVIPGLVRDTNYKFNVKAQYKTGFSNTSRKSEAIKTQSLVLLAPGQPKAVNITHNSIELTWKKPKPCGLSIEHYIVSSFCLDNDDNNDDDNDDDDDDDDDDHEPQCQSFETKRDENTILIPGLIDDTNYQFSVKAQYKTGLSKNSKKSAVIKTQPLLAVAGPPGKPSVVNTTSNSVTLSWEKPQENPHNVDRYKVLYHSKDEPWKTQPTDGAVEQITIDGLFPKKTYYFKVQAVYNQVEGETSTISEAVHTKHTLPSPGKPTAVHKTQNSVELHWSEPSKGLFKSYDKVKCYKVFYRSLHDSHDTWESRVIEGTRTNTAIHGLSPATEYIFKVQAGSSDYHFGKDSKESDVIMTNHIIPGCPGKPRSMKIGDSYVQLQWTKPVENVEHVEYYVVFYCSLDERTRKWKKYDNSASEDITVTGLTPDTRYSFKVQANSKSVSGKESVTSDVIQTLVPIPSKPGQPEAVSITHNSVNLKWAKPAQYVRFVMNYNVRYSSQTEQSKEWLSLNVSGVKENVTITGLSPKTTYFFKVEAQSKTGSSEMSDVSMPVLTLPPLPSTPGQPRAVDISQNKIKITWDKPQENAEQIWSYTIYYKSLKRNSKIQHISTTNDEWTTVKTENAVEEFVVSGLEVDTSYTFKVQAESVDGCSKESRISKAVQTLVPIPGKPGQPEAVSITHDRVELKWAKPAQYAEYVNKYCVSYYPQEEQSKETLVSVGKECVTIGDLLPDTTYLFKVQAQSKTESSEVNEISVRTLPPVPSQPGQPQAVKISHDEIAITWAKPQENAQYIQNYTIHYISLQKSDRHGWTTVKTENAVEVLVVSGLEINTSYIFKVQAESVDGHSKESEISNVIQTLVPIPSKPGQPEAVSITHDRVELKWAKPTQYAEYVANYHVSYSSQQEQSKEWRSFTVNGVEDNFTVTGLLPKTTYLFKVQGANKSGSSEISEVSEPICTLPPVPSKPGQPQAVNITHNKITITWAKPQEYAEQIRNYTVDYAKATDKHECKTVKTERADEVLVVSGLEPSTDYVFKVQAESVDGASEVSQTSNVIKTRCPVPSQPGKPKCKNKAHDRITLCWPKPNEYYENVECYKISYSDNKKEKTKVTDGRVEEIEIDGLDPQKGYYFKVKAKSKFGDSLNSLSSDLIGTNPVRPVLKIIPHCKKLQDSPTVYLLSMTQVTATDVQEYAKFEYGKATHGTKNKVLMIVGATGSGKSTLINGMINYLLGVEWDDEFRLKLIHEKVETQTKSVTKLISAYTFHKQKDLPLPYSLTIVDTPGFGDTEGVARDKEISNQIKEFFSLSAEQGIDHLDGIGFVTQGSLPRLSPAQKYIFNSIFAIFGRDMKDNIFTMVTFADGADPPVIEAIKEAEIPCYEYFQFNNSALYIDNTNIHAKTFWDMGATSFNEFFDKFGNIESVSLKLTREVLDQREQLETNIVGLQKLIHAGMSMIDSLKQQQQILKQNESKIKANENFEFKVEKDKMTKIDLKPGEYVTNCLTCNMVCHRSYTIRKSDHFSTMKDEKDKNTTCAVCPGKCAWDSHVNASYYFEPVKTQVTKCYEDIKKEYYKAKEGKTVVESMIANMETKIQLHFRMMLQNIQRAHYCIQRLDEIAFKHHPLNDVEYIDLLIETEIQEAKPGFEKRVYYYREVRKQAVLISKTKELPQQLSPEEGRTWWKQFLPDYDDVIVAALLPHCFQVSET